ncbi:MAG: hypothetical protein MI922_25785, partial [Bacteroidales bacterium]|nr:hypothetical protein [Bacteroidales bacterium]
RNSVDIVKNCIVLKKTANYTISGKTGGGVLPRNKHIMWLVGYLEKDGKTYFYALNFVSNDFNKHAGVRFKLVKDILREFKLI